MFTTIINPAMLSKMSASNIQNGIDHHRAVVATSLDRAERDGGFYDCPESKFLNAACKSFSNGFEIGEYIAEREGYSFIPDLPPAQWCATMPVGKLVGS